MHFLFENACSQKSDFENRINWGSVMCKMTRRFQIWPQISDQITFEPLFGQKTVENCQNIIQVARAGIFFRNTAWNDSSRQRSAISWPVGRTLFRSVCLSVENTLSAEQLFHSNSLGYGTVLILRQDFCRTLYVTDVPTLVFS